MNKNIFFFTILLLVFSNCKSQEKMKVIYVYDALCGWCYGFSPVMLEFQEKYKNELTIEVISGGMVTGDRIGPIGEVASYISWAYKDVEKATGVKFGSAFLENTLKKGEAIFTSIPASIALSIFKTADSTQSLQFASALQKAIYFDGMEPENTTAYGQIAEKFGLNAGDFTAKMKDSTFKLLAEADFNQSSTLKVSGFPTVFVEWKGHFYKVGSGYMPFQELEKNYLALKNKLK